MTTYDWSGLGDRFRMLGGTGAWSVSDEQRDLRGRYGAGAPPSYTELLERWGPGCVGGFLRLQPPRFMNTHRERLAPFLDAELEALLSDTGDILVFADSDNGDLCGWRLDELRQMPEPPVLRIPPRSYEARSIARDAFQLVERIAEGEDLFGIGPLPLTFAAMRADGSIDDAPPLDAPRGSFESYYRGHLEQVRGATDSNGADERALVSCEARIGRRLPPALRAFYRLAGADPLSSAHDRLLPADRISLAEEKLIFMEENQLVLLWGVAAADLDQEDPQVHRGVVHAGRVEWQPEGLACSRFLAMMLYFQAVMGGLPCCASGALTDDALARISAGSRHVGEHEGLRVHVAEGVVLCVVSGEDGLRLYAASDSLARIQTVARLFDVAIEEL